MFHGYGQALKGCATCGWCDTGANLSCPVCSLSLHLVTSGLCTCGTPQVAAWDTYACTLCGRAVMNCRMASAWCAMDACYLAQARARNERWGAGAVYTALGMVVQAQVSSHRAYHGTFAADCSLPTCAVTAATKILVAYAASAPAPARGRVCGCPNCQRREPPRA